MGDSASKTHALSRCARIRELNDQLRQTHAGGRIAWTHGVSQLGADTLIDLFVLLHDYDDFDNDNDPYGEHDMGSFKLGQASLLWKIDYLDRSLQYGSPDPADPNVTTRVLTIMLAEEY